LVNGFIDDLHTPVATTNNYNAIANPHAKSSRFAFTSRFLVTGFNNGDSSASVLTSLLSGEYPATNTPQPAWGPRYTASGWIQQFFLLFGRRRGDLVSFRPWPDVPRAWEPKAHAAAVQGEQLEAKARVGSTERVYRLTITWTGLKD
jgi:hypothetical protein